MNADIFDMVTAVQTVDIMQNEFQVDIFKVFNPRTLFGQQFDLAVGEFKRHIPRKNAFVKAIQLHQIWTFQNNLKSSVIICYFASQ